MQIDTVVYYQITDPKLYTYGIEQPILAIENLSATTLRNLIGDLELDQCLTSRDIVNTKMRQILDEATDPWGIKVNRVELKNILPPKEIQSAMEKQMKPSANAARPFCAPRARSAPPSSRPRAKRNRPSCAPTRKSRSRSLRRRPRRGHSDRAARDREGIRLINESMPSDAVGTEVPEASDVVRRKTGNHSRRPATGLSHHLSNRWTSRNPRLRSCC